MRSYVIVLAGLLGGAALVLASSQNTMAALPVRPSAVNLSATDCVPGPSPAPMAQTDAVKYQVEWTVSINQSQYAVGVTQVRDSLMWVSCGQATARIYIYNIQNPAHPLRDSFATGLPGWGLRDMEYHEANNTVYAVGDARLLRVYNATTHAVLANYTVTGGPDTLRAMGIWPGPNDSLMTGSFLSPSAAKMSATGTNHHAVGSLPNVATYGCTYDSTAGCWWFSEAWSSGSKIFRVNHPAITKADSFVPAGWSTGGGLGLWRRDTFLLALHQGSPDMVYCIRVKFPANDAGMTEVERPTTFGEFPLAFGPRARVTNFGSNPQNNFYCRCEIRRQLGTIVYRESVLVTPQLLPDSSRWLTFPNWASPTIEPGYEALFTSLLPGDGNPANNSVSQTFPIDDTLECKWDITDVANPANGWIWYGAGSGWLHCFPEYWNGVKVVATKVGLHPNTWPVPGGDQYAVSIQDDNGTGGAPGTVLFGPSTQTGVRGGWHTYTLPTPVSCSTGRWYVKYTQTQAYPNCPGLAIDGLRNSPGWSQWQEYPAGTYAACDFGGDWAIRCFITKQITINDVGVTDILAPTGSVDSSATVIPSAGVHNYGNAPMSFGAWFVISDATTDAEVYREAVAVTGLSAGADTTLEWIEWPKPHAQGPYTTLCSLAVSDLNPGNNYLTGAFTVQAQPPWPSGWTEVNRVPGAVLVKDGGFLAVNSGNGLIYLAPGNKSHDFYAYEPTGDAYTPLTPIPTGAKPPKKGCDGITDNDNYLYLTKGNNTLEFWRYNISTNAWESLPSVPPGPSGKGCKKGTDLSYVTGLDADYVYLLKGYGTEFYRFDVGGMTWAPALTDVPAGAKAKVDEGSWLCWDEGTTLYFLKAKYNELWPYDLSTGAWGAQLPSMPFIHPMVGKKKKAKDGGAGALSNGSIYALKGGNTCEFWKYTPGDSWTGIDTMPQVGSTGKKKRVKTGGDLVHWDAGAFFATKGNKTSEMWRYVLPPYATRHTPCASRIGPSSMRPDSGDGVSSSLERNAYSVMRISPNPFVAGLATLALGSCVEPDAYCVVRVYDASGRCVLTRALGHLVTGTLSLDLRRLGAGVYLVRLEAGGFTATRKLVVER